MIRKSIRCIGILGLLALLWMGASQVFATSLDESAYWSQLGETARLLDEAIRQTRVTDRQTTCNRIRVMWNGVDSVRLADSSTMRVDMNWILNSLDAQNLTALRTLKQQVSGLISFHDRPLNQNIDVQKALQTLEDMLNRNSSGQTSDQLGGSGSGGNGGNGGNSGNGGSRSGQGSATDSNPLPQNNISLNIPPEIGQLVLIIGALVIVGGVLIFLARGLKLRRVQMDVIAPEGQADDPTTSDGAKAKADESVESQDYRNAMRYLYLACLIRLDERGLLRYDRTLTNREYLRVVANHEALIHSLRPVVDTFDRVWYGFAPVSEGLYREYRAQVEALDRLTPSITTTEKARV